MLFNSIVAAAEREPLPDDFSGEATLYMLTEDGDDEKTSTFTLGMVGLYEIAQYIYEKYPDGEIYEEDFYEKLRPFFPEDSDNDLIKKQIMLGNIISAYKNIKDMYGKYAEKMLVPDTHRRIRDESEYDHRDEVPYMEAKEGHFIKVYNFKKFISYGDNQSEKDAIAEFEQNKSPNANLMAKMKKWAKQMEWKKLFFYGPLYENPLLSKNGVSEIQNGFGVKAKLLSQSTYINNRDKLRFGVELDVAPYMFIAANDLSEAIRKPKIDLRGSKNVKDYEVMYPAPLTSPVHPEVHKYFGDFMLLMEVTPLDKTKPIHVQANVTVFTCDNNLNCGREDFNPSLTIEPYGDEDFGNGYENFFYVNSIRVPTAKNKGFALQNFWVDKDENGQSLRLEFDSRKRIDNFKIFVEEVDGFTLFSAPMINLQDHKIYVRIEQNGLPSDYDLSGSEFIVTAILNNTYYYRDKLIPNSVSDPKDFSAKINIGLLFIALICGIVLNVMPCVFPLNALKIYQFSIMRSRNRKNIKRSSFMHIGGIFCAATILIGALMMLKLSGVSLGWGLQFRSMYLVIGMCIAAIILLNMLPQLNLGATATTYTKKLKQNDFVIGSAVSLAAAVCFAPYLNTVTSFALEGSYFRLLIFYVTALGLALPYILFAYLPAALRLIPQSGKFLLNLFKITIFMLYLCILWLCFLILSQTNWKFTLTALVILLLFGFITSIYGKFLYYIKNEENDFTNKFKNNLKRRSYVFAAVFVAVFAITLSYFGQKNMYAHYAQNAEQRLYSIDETKIAELLAKGHSVLLEVTSDWCLSCRFNKLFRLSEKNLKDLQTSEKLEIITVDWSDQSPKTLEYMRRYGRNSLPFYVLYTPFIREGIALPYTFNAGDLQRYLAYSYVR